MRVAPYGCSATISSWRTSRTSTTRRLELMLNTCIYLHEYIYSMCIFNVSIVYRWNKANDRCLQNKSSSQDAVRTSGAAGSIKDENLSRRNLVHAGKHASKNRLVLFWHQCFTEGRTGQANGLCWFQVLSKELVLSLLIFYHGSWLALVYLGHRLQQPKDSFVQCTAPVLFTPDLARHTL